MANLKFANELTELNSKLGVAMEVLSKIKELPSGHSKNEVVYSEDKIKLLKFKNNKGVECKTPLLIVYALVNRYFMADLDEKRSLIKGLLDNGIDVYTIDWGYPDQGDRFLDMDDYINGYLHNCVEFIRESNGIEAVNLLGICQGGTFSLCYTSMYPDNVKNLVTMVTPVDFKTEDNILGNLAENIDIDLAIDTLGNINGEILNRNFASLMPISLNFHKYIKSLDSLQTEDSAQFFLKMENWINDSPNQCGEVMREFLTDFYQQNKLVKGTKTIGGVSVNLKNIKQPILNVYGTDDHLVPPTSSAALEKHVGSKDYTEAPIKTGHIGMYVSGKSRSVPPMISDWLKKRDAS